MLQRLFLFLHLLRSLIDYPLRQLFRWRRKGLQIINEDKASLYNHLAEPSRSQAEAAASRLREAYHLEPLYSTSTRDNYQENLFYLAMLESAFSTVSPQFPEKLNAADIGPSHWFYVQALYAALKWWRCPAGREVTLTGFERDAYRIYSDLYSRYDHALAHIGRLQGVTYIPVAFKVQPASYHVVTQFFPFIFLSDHLKWGLPPAMFNPSALLVAAWLSIKPGGLLIIVNQGKAEHTAQLEHLRRANIPVQAAFVFNSPLYHYNLPRFITIACREHG